jgi:hypothetical protein
MSVFSIRYMIYFEFYPVRDMNSMVISGKKKNILSFEFYPERAMKSMANLEIYNLIFIKNIRNGIEKN